MNSNFRITLGGFGVILFVVFLILKLTGVIAWSWLWVTAPLWLPLAVTLGIFLIILLIGLFAAVIASEHK